MSVPLNVMYVSCSTNCHSPARVVYCVVGCQDSGSSYDRAVLLVVKRADLVYKRAVVLFVRRSAEAMIVLCCWIFETRL